MRLGDLRKKEEWMPEIGEEYYLADPCALAGVSIAKWEDTTLNKQHKIRKLMHKTKPEAIRATCRMLKTLEEKDDN